MRKYIVATKEVFGTNGASWYVISFALSFGLNIIFTFIAAGHLGVRAFGIFTLLTSMTQIGVSIVNAGFYTSALTKAGPHSAGHRVTALLGTRISTSVTIAQMLIVLVAIPLALAKHGLELYIITGSVYIWLSSIQPLWLYQVKGEHRMFNQTQILQRVSYVLPGIAAMLCGKDLTWICIIWGASPITSALVFYQGNPQAKRYLYDCIRLKTRAMRSALITISHEGRFLIADLLATVAVTIPSILIARSSSLADVGIYSFVDKLKGYGTAIYAPFNNSQYTRLCSLCSQGLYREASKLITRYWLAIGSLASIGAVGGLSTVLYMVQAFGNGEYAPGKLAMSMFWLSMPLLAICSGFNLLYFSSQRITRFQNIGIGFKIVIFALCYYVLTQIIGAVTSAAAAYIASELGAILGCYWMSLPTSKLRLRLR